MKKSPENSDKTQNNSAISLSSVETQRQIRIQKLEELKKLGHNPFPPTSKRDFNLGFIHFWFNFVHHFDFTKLGEDEENTILNYFLEQVLFPQSLVEKLEEKIRFRHTVREMGLDPDEEEDGIEDEFEQDLIDQARSMFPNLLTTPSETKMEYLSQYLIDNSEENSIEDGFEMKLHPKQTVYLAGRIKSKRISGKIAFATVEDESHPDGFQFIFKQDALPELSVPNQSLTFEQFKNLIDEGDYIQAKGKLDYSQRGEPSLFVEEFCILTKTLRPLPEKLDYENIEERYTNRVVDFKMNTKDENNVSIREIIRLKSKFWQIWREEMLKEDFLEVECPVFEPIPGGAEARPFTTFYNEMDQEMYLRISLELPLKKMIAGGFEKVFEIGRIFRNEGASPQHLQEYTQIEFYWAYTDYNDVMKFVKKIHQRLVQEIIGQMVQVDYYGHSINWGEWCSNEEAKKNGWELVDGWPKIPYYEAIRYYSKGEVDLENKTLAELKTIAKKYKIEIEKADGIPRLTDKIYKKTARINMHNPFFLVLPPVELEPLAKRNPEKPNLTERFQLVAGTAELGKGFSELNDPLDQYNRFMDQQSARDAGDEEAQFMDENYVKALEYGLPPLSGWGSSERTFSFLFGKHIKECVTFPHTRAKLDNKDKTHKKPVDKQNNNITTDSQQTTKLDYLENTYLFESKAKILDFVQDENGLCLILDQTIFYPQGGGQPSDSGLIYNDNFRFQVKKCIFNDGLVLHYGEIESGELQKEVEVMLKIDSEKRALNARNHTAGHLIDLALQDAGLDLKPIKGYHFPEGPYVEYEGNLDNSPETVSQIEQALKNIIAKNPKISFELVNDTNHPSGKPMRIMHLEGYPDCPCGGTHVDELSKIGQINIRKIKNSGNTVRIAYQVI